jgi:hypothetical protein
MVAMIAQVRLIHKLKTQSRFTRTADRGVFPVDGVCGSDTFESARCLVYVLEVESGGTW